MKQMLKNNGNFINIIIVTKFNTLYEILQEILG